MYVNRMMKSALALTGAAVILTACSDSAKAPTMAPDVDGVYLTLGNALDQVGTGVVATEVFKVCKTYAGGGPMPAVTINISAVDNSNAGNVGNTSVSLAGGQCKNVWIAGGTGATVTATEVVPADYVAAWEKWDDLGDNLEAGTLDASGPGNVASGVVTGSVPAGGAGTTIRFTNRYEPPQTGEGCTPGYWRQEHHFGNWTAPYDPTDSFNSTFGIGTAWFANSYTLLDGVWAGGGGKFALARHAVAALLNAASANVDYDYSVAQVIAKVQAAYANSALIESTKNDLAAKNELGCGLARAELDTNN